MTANMNARPRWDEDDYFGDALAKIMPKAKGGGVEIKAALLAHERGHLDFRLT